ncbi:hypothetical protein FACS189426_06430 [Bacteroidia bacterium]|nr:hypothetical protein FACS189426_06430 [Bacteroidia bacterium]GHV71994.1 hypothetical protein FACS189420_8570 [Bacteroidia bacterium]
MKAITVKQPWAHLICAGIKDVENRTWKTNYRGRVLIHSSAGNKFSVNLTDEQMIAAFGTCAQSAQTGSYYFSAIIGSVEIVDCVQNNPSVWADKTINKSRCPNCDSLKIAHQHCYVCGFDWKEKQVYNWVLANPVLFAKPIKNAKGKLSFWESGHDVCHICGQPADLICAVCGEYFCPDCSAHYSQFMQIDYDCCKRCQDSMKER